MTDKNTDVEWLREQLDSSTEWICGERRLFARLLVHIDQLEADIEDFKTDVLRRALCNEPEPDRRPTVHEIAAQMMAACRANQSFGKFYWDNMARSAYEAAEALVAEGRRRDGNG